MGLHDLLRGSFACLYAGDVRISQETSLCACTASYGDSFTFLYADDMRASQETRLWACNLLKGIAYLFHFNFPFTNHSKENVRSSIM
jgi:hypothetical protein